MKDIIKSLIDLLKGLGIQNDYINSTIIGLLVLSALISVAAALWKVVNKIISVRNQRLLNEDLNPYFTRQDVYRATRYFIPTMGQNVSPAEDDEPGRMYIAAAKNKLIPLFLKKVFNDDADSNKYYLVLADTGMGKTTFLINLYLRYKNQWKYILNLSKPRNIALFPLGDPRVLETVGNLPDKKNTILLLDAFDEDIAALDNHKKRMVEILDKVQDFRTIVITCRTQFFPSEEEEPHKTGYFSFGGSGEYKFQKLYLSVFDNSDVKKYLRLRFSIFSISSYFKAKEIVRKCPNLVVRPMLLSRINDLIGSDNPFDYSFQIYKVMIEKWIERESNKPSVLQRPEADKYPEMLYQFSRALAVDLYKNKEKRGGYLISKDEKISLHSQIQIADIESEYKELTLSEKEARTQSLLNRNSNGQYKFSHKSFLEYFLAKELLDNSEFCLTFDFEGMSAAKSFYHEMLVVRLIQLNGYYIIPAKSLTNSYQALKRAYTGISTKADHFEGTGHSLKDAMDPNEIVRICKIKIKEVGNFNLLSLSEFTNLKVLTVYDSSSFPNLYEMYSRYLTPIIIPSDWTTPSYGLGESEIDIVFSLLAKRFMEWLDFRRHAERLGLETLARRIKPRHYWPGPKSESFTPYAKYSLAEGAAESGLELESNQIESELKRLQDFRHLIDREASYVERSQMSKEILGLEQSAEFQRRLYLSQNSGSRTIENWLSDSNREIQRANQFLAEMETLQKKLPNCRMYY